jgi:hypothetical protein
VREAFALLRIRHVVVRSRLVPDDNDFLLMSYKKDLERSEVRIE